ncbi:hypothetical protein CLOM_g6483 [Closterium sp. NIES-68]|nr:hypothetical protein CLOM_g6483 [Closterium sp. NIES-68]
MNGRDMRFMVQWASSSAATSADPRSLFHSSVPEHSTTTDRGSLSFSSRTPLVPALRRNRSSNAGLVGFARYRLTRVSRQPRHRGDGSGKLRLRPSPEWRATSFPLPFLPRAPR